MDEVTAVRASANISDLPIQPFFCEICMKPFANESSRNRHIPYCRRTQSRRRTRVVSCRACSVAKTKCSSDTRCSRCVFKGLDCIYDDRRKSQKRYSPPRSTTSASSNLPLKLQEGNADEDPLPRGLSDSFWLSSIDYGLFTNDVPRFMGSLGLDEAQPPRETDQSVTGELSTMADKDTIDLFQFSEVSRGSSLQSILPYEDATSQPVWHGEDHWSSPSIPMQVSRYESTCVLKHISMKSPIAQYSAKHIIGTLRAYPRMMVRKTTFPPFIHPRWGGALPEPLANCMGVAQMYSSRTSDTNAFVWRTIRMEQQRLVDENLSFSKENLLAAIQAYMLYVIMRMDDETRFTESDFQMILSFGAMCTRFKQMCCGSFSHHERFEDPSWEDWIFSESRRRVAILWFLVSRVVCVATDTPCNTPEEIQTLPLSSPKSLWEANRRSLWQEEYEAYKVAQSTKLSAFGQLLDAQRGAVKVADTRKLDAWNSGIDNLGTLLNLVTATF